MGKKLSTFIGDSTYTRAPPTYRSPLRSNYQMKPFWKPFLRESEVFL